MMRTPVRVALGVVATVLGLYWTGANLFLNSKSFAAFWFPKPEKLIVTVERGWSILPGFVHVQGLQIRGQTKRIQWECRLQEGDVRLSLFRLANRTVRITRVRGSALSYHQRQRLDVEGADAQAAAHFPEIEGLSNPPNPTPEDLYPPREKKKRGWIIDLSDVGLEGDLDLWVGRTRVTGHGLVSADMRFQIRSDLILPRVEFDLSRGVLRVDSAILAEGLDISLEGTTTAFTPKQAKGTKVFEHLFGSIRMENGTVPDLTILNAFLRTGGGLEFRGGSASMSFRSDKSTTDQGSRGHLELSANGADLLFAGTEVVGDISLDSELLHGSLADGRWEVGESRLDLENVEFEVGDGAPSGDPWWGHVRVTRGKLDMGQPTDLDLEVSFELKDTAPLLHLWTERPGRDADDQVPGWVKFVPDIRNVRGDASMDLDERGLTLDDMVILGEGFALLGRLRADSGSRSGQLYLRYKLLDVGLDLHDGKRDLKILRPKKWFLEQLELDDSSQIELPESLHDTPQLPGSQSEPL